MRQVQAAVDYASDLIVEQCVTNRVFRQAHLLMDDFSSPLPGLEREVGNFLYAGELRR